MWALPLKSGSCRASVLRSLHSRADQNTMVPPSKSFKEKKQWMDDQRKKSKEDNEKANNSGLRTPWQYKAAVIVERPQLILPEPEPWFSKYNEWRIRWDSPILAQFPPVVLLDQDLDEIKQKRDEEARVKKETAKQLDRETEEEKKERLDREDREKRLKEIRDAHEKAVVTKERSRETEADRKGDYKSLYRALDKRLFLIVKKNRGEHSWQFPQGLVNDGDTLRLAAERSFADGCNTQNKLETHFAGNGPAGFVTYAYPQQLQKQSKSYGCKVFFMYAYYLQGSVSLNSDELTDYKWVTKPELKDHLSEELLSAVWDVLPADGKNEYLERAHYHNMPEKK